MVADWYAVRKWLLSSSAVRGPPRTSESCGFCALLTRRPGHQLSTAAASVVGVIPCSSLRVTFSRSATNRRQGVP